MEKYETAIIVLKFTSWSKTSTKTPTVTSPATLMRSPGNLMGKTLTDENMTETKL